MTSGKLALAGVVMSSGLLAFQAPAANPSVDAALAAFQEQLLAGRRTADLLAPGRELLVKLIRNDASAAKSWQLEPSLTKELKDDELFAFVTDRADAMVSCSLYLYSKVAIEKMTPEAVDSVNARGAFWPPAASTGPLRISADCFELVDADNRSARLRTRKDFSAFLNVQESFYSKVRVQEFGRGIAGDPLVRSNLNYLRREYGGPPQDEPDLDAAVGVPGARVYSGLTATLQTYVLLQGDRATPIFVAPLSH